GAGERATRADFDALHAVVPAGDDLADTEAEVERGAAVVRRVELLARRVGHATLEHGHGAPGRGLRPVTLGQLDDREVTGRGAVGRIDLGLLSSHGLHP